MNTCNSSTRSRIYTALLYEEFFQRIAAAFPQEERYLQIFHRKKKSCNSFTGRIIPTNLLHEEEYLQLFQRSRISVALPTGRRIPANILHEEEYIQLSYMKETTSSFAKGRKLHEALI